MFAALLPAATSCGRRPDPLPGSPCAISAWRTTSSKAPGTASCRISIAEGPGPLDVVNGPLMAGVADVGRLFNNNELIVVEVLLSAEAMKAVMSYLRDGNAIHLFAAGGGAPIHTFRFGRQRRENGPCLSDYILDADDGRRDHLAIFVATAGACIRERAEEWKHAGQFFKSHAIQALALETAEGTAEWLHRRIREDWGFPDPPTTTMQDRFTSRYRGKRYSFGYPACPNLDDQQGIWKLLQPESIGVRLTEGMMMDPEASVSALVFHHPDCAYFTADEGEVASVP